LNEVRSFENTTLVPNFSPIWGSSTVLSAILEHHSKEYPHKIRKRILEKQTKQTSKKRVISKKL
jgi:hypothetical protein